MKPHSISRNLGPTLFATWILCVRLNAFPSDHLSLKSNQPSMIADGFESWLARYNRTYESRAERELRFEIYQANVLYIDFIYGLRLPFELIDNRFADMTNEEFGAAYLGFQRRMNLRTDKETHVTDDADMDGPTSFDWRKEGAVTLVKDQGVTMIGYGVEGRKKYWIVKNLWGRNLGEGGYVRMLKNSRDLWGMCRIAMDSSYPVKC